MSFLSASIKRPKAVKRALSLLAILWVTALLMPGSASALSGTQWIGFSEYPLGTEISTQYQGVGVVFRDEEGFFPEVHWDESASTNPILSGTFGFGSPISAQFVVPGTTTPATVENLAMDVGYVDEPGSTELIVEKTNGPFVLFANEEGFNHLFLGGGAITGFVLQPIEDEPAGFTLDNLEFTIPAPPPPPPPPPAPSPTPETGCVVGNGPLWREVVAGLKCKLALPALAAKCGVGVALNLPQLKAAKVAGGLYDLSKVEKSLKPVAKLFNDVRRAKLLPDAPKGFRTTEQVIERLRAVDSALDLVELIPSLARAFPKKDYLMIVNDIVDIAGVRPCLDLLTT